MTRRNLFELVALVGLLVLVLVTAPAAQAASVGGPVTGGTTSTSGSEVATDNRAAAGGLLSASWSYQFPNASLGSLWTNFGVSSFGPLQPLTISRDWDSVQLRGNIRPTITTGFPTNAFVQLFNGFRPMDYHSISFGNAVPIGANSIPNPVRVLTNGWTQLLQSNNVTPSWFVVESDFASPGFMAITNRASTNTLLLVPPNVSTPARLIVYAHGRGGSELDFFEDDEKWGVASNLLSEGWMVLSHLACETNWGNECALDQYEEAITWATNQFSVTNVSVIGASMGGLAALSLTARNDYITHAYLIFGVCSLTNIYWNDSGTSPGASNQVETAYGFTGVANFAAATAGYDPSTIASNSFAGRKFRFIGNNSDTVVPASEHMWPMSVRLTNVATVTITNQPSGGHGDPSAWHGPDVVTFLKQ